MLLGLDSLQLTASENFVEPGIAMKAIISSEWQPGQKSFNETGSSNPEDIRGLAVKALLARFVRHITRGMSSV